MPRGLVRRLLTTPAREAGNDAVRTILADHGGHGRPARAAASSSTPRRARASPPWWSRAAITSPTPASADDRRADQRAGRRPDRAARRAASRAARSAGCPRSTTAVRRASAAHPTCRVGAKVARPAARRRSPSARPRNGPPSPRARWPWAIVDEAYQMRSDALLRVAARFERALFVGDPGQLDPFSTVEVDRWTGLSLGPDAERGRGAAAAQPGPAGAPPAGVLAAAGLGRAGGRRGVLPVHRLPLRHRARRPRAGPSTGRRRHARSTEALDAAAAHRLGPARAARPASRVRTDAEAAAACAALAARPLRPRGGRASPRPATGPLTADRIAIGAAHRDQVAGDPRRSLPAPRPRDHGGHGQPAAGPGVRPDDRAAPAVRPARRDRLPPGVGPAVRADLPAPARLRGGRPGRASPSCWTPTRRPSRCT